MTKPEPEAVYPDVTRLVVVGDQGKILEKWDLFRDGVELHLQDEGRTLKIFPRQAATPNG